MFVCNINRLSEGSRSLNLHRIAPLLWSSGPVPPSEQSTPAERPAAGSLARGAEARDRAMVVRASPGCSVLIPTHRQIILGSSVKVPGRRIFRRSERQTELFGAPRSGHAKFASNHRTSRLKLLPEAAKTALRRSPLRPGASSRGGCTG